MGDDVVRKPVQLGVVGVAVAAGVVVWGSCRPAAPPPPPRPPIILVSIDTLRSDRLPAYGYSVGATPAIDALAKDGVLFERAYAEVPLTLPSHTSLLTGLLPPTHGVRDNVGFPVDPSKGMLLAQRLGRLGYATAAAVSTEVLARRTGINVGFDVYDDPAGSATGVGAGTIERPGGDTVKAALDWLAGVGDRPFFLFLHLYEPHAPYRPAPAFAGRFADPYDGEIATADELLGRLVADLRRRGIYDRALVILVSDHGEGLGEHGEDEHGVLLYREALQVPLIVKLPGGQQAGTRVARPVALVDVVPTVLAALGETPPPELPGRSLLATDVAVDRPLYAETMYPLIHFGWSDLGSVVAGDLHFIDGPNPELFDLAHDHGEQSNRLADFRRPLAEMRRFLDGVDRTLAAPQQVSRETTAALGALGYLGTVDLPSDRRNLDDPRAKLATVGPVLRGIRAYREGDYALAVSILAAAVKQPDAVPHAWQFLGAAYDALGRKADALAAYQKGMRLAGSPSYLSETAALRLLELGRPQAAYDLVKPELARHPESAVLSVLASRALAQLGRLDEAGRAADEAIRRDGKLADGYYQRAVVALSRQDGAAAIPDLEQAVALDAKHVEARKALAMVRYAQGDVAATKRLLTEVLAIDPADADARDDLRMLEAKATGGG
jgi:arylsulfatase A-like enzyme/Flp pilus assembly protein TadD